MSGITLANAQSNLDALQAAYTALIGGTSSYSITTTSGSRSLTRRDLSEVREEITHWDRQVKKLTRGGISIRGVTPIG